MHVFNISQCFLAEKCMIPIFSDVFSEKNACFKFLLSFSPVKIPGAKIYHYFLAEKCMFPIFLEFLSGKNPRCQNLFYFSCGKISVAKISRCFLGKKCPFPIFPDIFLQQNWKLKKIIVVLPIQNTYFLNLSLNPMLKEKTLFTDNCLLITVWHHFYNVG